MLFTEAVRHLRRLHVFRKTWRFLSFWGRLCWDIYCFHSSYSTFSFFFSFRKTTNLWMITIAFALLSHVTCSIFEDVGVTCELEQESVRVCGNQEVKVNKCRGTCQSSSRIIMTKPWYRTTCACCKSKKSNYKEVSCNDGRVKQIFSAVSCQCQMCNGA